MKLPYLGLSTIYNSDFSARLVRLPPNIIIFPYLVKPLCIDSSYSCYFRIDPHWVVSIFELKLIMARSKETFSKKEVEKKKLQKRKEKQKRREERKANPGRSFEDMIAYTDENGNIISTPPDPSKKKEIKTKDIIIGARNSGGDEEEVDPVRKGKVAFFNNSKGYGFIRDLDTNENIFVHVNGLVNSINENDKVTFETERGPRGLNAIKVTLIE